MRGRRTLLPSFCLLALVLVVPASADEGRIPLSSAADLYAPGEYVLTRDISTDEQVRIFADGVVLNLNGRTIQSSSTVLAAILIDPGAIGGSLDRGVTIRNGRIKGGRFGIRVYEGTGGRVRIEDVEIVGSVTHGILVRGLDEFTIRDCRIRDIGDDGVSYQPESYLAPGQASVVGNVINSASGVGMFISGVTGSQISGNVVLGAGKSGLFVVGDGNRVSDNVVHDAGRIVTASGMMVLGEDNRIENNVASGSSGSGIEMEPDSHRAILRGNVAAGNASDGIIASGNQSFVEDNVASGNGRYGLYADMIAGLVVYRGNLLLGNGSGSAGDLSSDRLDDQGGNICAGSCP